MAQIPDFKCCDSQHLTEYYHDNNQCDSEECYVVECITCDTYKTLCEQE